jgi:hypothetical protein
MQAVTYYVALSFVRDPDGKLVSGDAKQCPNGQSAVWLTRQLAQISDGSVALSRAGNSATGEFADAVVLRSFDEVLSVDDLVDTNV